jgi:hypothetical protein
MNENPVEQKRIVGPLRGSGTPPRPLPLAFDSERMKTIDAAVEVIKAVNLAAANGIDTKTQSPCFNAALDLLTKQFQKYTNPMLAINTEHESDLARRKREAEEAVDHGEMKLDLGKPGGIRVNEQVEVMNLRVETDMKYGGGVVLGNDTPLDHQKVIEAMEERNSQSRPIILLESYRKMRTAKIVVPSGVGDCDPPKKYVVIGGYIQYGSGLDARREWVSFSDLIRLYKVNPDECYCFESEVSTHGYTWSKDAIFLRPDPTGKYEIPEPAKQDCGVIPGEMPKNPCAEIDVDSFMRP